MHSNYPQVVSDQKFQRHLPTQVKQRRRAATRIYRAAKECSQLCVWSRTTLCDHRLRPWADLMAFLLPRLSSVSTPSFVILTFNSCRCRSLYVLASAPVHDASTTSATSTTHDLGEIRSNNFGVWVLPGGRSDTTFGIALRRLFRPLSTAVATRSERRTERRDRGPGRRHPPANPHRPAAVWPPPPRPQPRLL